MVPQQERDHLDELVILFAKLADFLQQKGEELPLEVLPEVMQRGRHTDPIIAGPKRSKISP